MTDLVTARLRIRPVRASDAETLYAAWQLVQRFQGPVTRTLDESRARYAAMEQCAPGSGWYQWVVCAITDGAIVGDLGADFGRPSPRQAELGYTIHPAHQGHGYGTEAVARFVSHLFDDHGLHRCIAITGANNPRSQRLLDKLGFRREARFVESWWQHDEARWVDEIGYAMLAHEWRANRP